MKRKSRLVTWCCLLLLAGCASVDPDADYLLDPALYAQAIDQSEDRFPEIAPLHLDEEIKHWLDAQLGPDRGSEAYRVSALQELLYGESHLNIQYSDRKTHTATEVFHARQGNCLSVMNLYVAMARHLGVDARFQTVKVQPSWDRRGGLLVLSQHINATGRLAARRHYVVDFTPEIALQQLTERTISDSAARALHFNNLAVEALVAGETGQALAYVKNALFIDPANSDAWNNLGTAYKLLGNLPMAEFSYHYALRVDEGNATAVSNLVKLYRKRGDEALARRYERIIDGFNRRNPYFQYAQGQRAYRSGDFAGARDHFQRAIRLKEHEPDFHLGLASAHAQLGDFERAQQARDAAARVLKSNEAIYRPSERKLRIIDDDSILHNAAQGFSIEVRSGIKTFRPR